MQSPHKKSFAAEQLRRRKRVSPVVWVILGVVVIALIVGGNVIYQRSVVQKQIGTEVQQIKSIAVLPFVDMSEKKDQEWFCDGIAEDIINALSQIDDLHVLARTSSFAFKGQNMDIREIGRELEVDAVFEGSVTKYGNQFRIAAQLVNVADGFHILSRQYDYEMKDVLGIRDDISLKIVNALKIELGEEEKTAIEKRYTKNVEAYNLYLQGRHHWNRRTEDGFIKAIEFFKQALKKDPYYALAYAGIADSYNLLGYYGFMHPDDTYPRAKAAAEKALAIDDNLGEAHNSLAWFSQFYDFDWLTAEREYKKSIMLNPHYPTTHHWYAVYLLAMGRLNEAVTEISRAQELDPLSLVIYQASALIYNMLEQYDEALKQCQKAIELDPNYGLIYLRIGTINFNKGNYKEAKAAFNKALELSGSISIVEGSLGQTYAISGERTEAEQLLKELINRKNMHYVSSTAIALIYTGLGENDKAIEWLEKAYEERDSQLLFIKVAQRWDSLRSDSRFKDLLKRMKFPED